MNKNFNKVIGYCIIIRENFRSIFLRLECGHEKRIKISQAKPGIPNRVHCRQCNLLQQENAIEELRRDFHQYFDDIDPDQYVKEMRGNK